MNEAVELPEKVIEEAIRSVATEGLENLSLRTISAAAGCSTSVVFKYFGNKEGLISAALDQVLKIESSFHEELESHIRGITFHHQGFSDLMANYIDLRADQVHARFCSEILFKSQHVPQANDFIRNWHKMRTAFWRSRLVQSTCEAPIEEIIATFIVMEEVYTFSLHSHLEYRLLRAETCRALTAKAFGVSGEGQSDISIKLGEGSPRFLVGERSGWNRLCESMLDAAASEIISKSITSVNQRKIAKKANTSSSMIAYHFGSFDEFVNEAIWRAMIVDRPTEFNILALDAPRHKDLDEWSNVLARFIVSGKNEEKGDSFYVNFSRITGQVSLLAKRRHELLPLIDHLRNYEGSGSYRSSKTTWPEKLKIDRSTATAFGVWIKGQAILNQALSASFEYSKERLLKASSLFL